MLFEFSVDLFAFFSPLNLLGIGKKPRVSNLSLFLPFLSRCYRFIIASRGEIIIGIFATIVRIGDHLKERTSIGFLSFSKQRSRDEECKTFDCLLDLRNRARRHRRRPRWPVPRCRSGHKISSAFVAHVERDEPRRLSHVEFHLMFSTSTLFYSSRQSCVHDESARLVWLTFLYRTSE